MRGWGLILGPIILAFLLAIWPGWLAARPAPSINIATAIDVSDSINEEDFLLEMEGLARGVTDERFLAHLGDGVGFEVFTWSSRDIFDTIVPYIVVRGPEEAFTVAALLRSRSLNGIERYSPRHSSGGNISSYTGHQEGMTDTSAAMDEGVRRLLARPAERFVLNVLADGPDNIAEEPNGARDRAQALGVTVNAIIFGDAYGNSEYFRNKVVTGVGAFVKAVGSPAEMLEALEQKFFLDMIALEGG